MKQGRWPGTWKVVCDVCGFWYSSDKVKKRWDGLITCEKDWESKHPQLSIRIPKEQMVPDFVRPEPTDLFRTFCTPWGRSGFADLGEAGCAQADNAIPNYVYLVALRNDSLRTE